MENKLKSMKEEYKRGDYYVLRKTEEWPNNLRNLPFMTIFPGLSLKLVQEFGILVFDSYNKKVHETEEMYFKIIQAGGNSFKTFEFPKSLICQFFTKNNNQSKA